jgi:heterokaryon incompatibility protein (HET)
MSTQDLYQPLDNERREIRLIEILSRACDADIICQLITVSLNDAPRFTALSYVWGDPSVTEPIVLNGSALHITTNLATALRHVKHRWQAEHSHGDPVSFRLWTDTISINQHDIIERNSQVDLMRAIYSTAELVISWLGSDRDEIGVGIDTLNVNFQRNWGNFQR